MWLILSLVILIIFFILGAFIVDESNRLKDLRKAYRMACDELGYSERQLDKQKLELAREKNKKYHHITEATRDQIRAHLASNSRSPIETAIIQPLNHVSNDPAELSFDKLYFNIEKLRMGYLYFAEPQPVIARLAIDNRNGVVVAGYCEEQYYDRELQREINGFRDKKELIDALNRV